MNGCAHAGQSGLTNHLPTLKIPVFPPLGLLTLFPLKAYGICIWVLAEIESLKSLMRYNLHNRFL